MACCGKLICNGCIYAPIYDNHGNKVDRKCPFCRYHLEETTNNKMIKRVEANDPLALYNIGCYHRDGLYGFPQDYHKALELWHRAAELGHAGAYTCIGIAYNRGEGVEVDKKKATHFWELAAMRGDVYANTSLGAQEVMKGNKDRALKHFMIAVKGGESNSLNLIKQMCHIGHATKDDTQRHCNHIKHTWGEIKSAQRDKAAAADEGHRYY